MIKTYFQKIEKKYFKKISNILQSFETKYNNVEVPKTKQALEGVKNNKSPGSEYLPVEL